MTKNHLSKREIRAFWTTFFGVELGDVIETKVKRYPWDTYHKVFVEVIGTYPDPFHEVRDATEFATRVVKDFDNIGLLRKHYLIKANEIRRIIRKCPSFLSRKRM